MRSHKHFEQMITVCLQTIILLIFIFKIEFGEIDFILPKFRSSILIHDFIVVCIVFIFIHNIILLKKQLISVYNKGIKHIRRDVKFVCKLTTLKNLPSSHKPQAIETSMRDQNYTLN